MRTSFGPRWAGVVGVLLAVAGLSCGDTTTPLTSIPTQIAFGTQPSNQVAGSAIAPAVRVNILDADGLLVTEATTSVTLEMASNPGGGTLGGTTTVKAVGGQATFSDLWIDKAASGYTLTAKARVQGGEGTATSGAFDVTHGVADQLTFTVGPSNVTAGETITPPIEVTVFDAFGNPVLEPAIDVTVQLAGGTSPSADLQPVASDSGRAAGDSALPSAAAPTALKGTTTVSTVDGVAVFNDLSIDEAASGYTLTASSGSLSSAPSTAFATIPASPSGIGFRTQPSDGTSNQRIPAFEVAITDAFGNVATTSTGSITVALGVNPGGSLLSGTTTRDVVNGVATFDDLILDRAGLGYTLTANSTGFSAATSEAFSISLPQLQFITQPSSAAAGVAIAPPVRVGIFDHLQALITSASNAVTLSIDSNPASGSISGRTTVNAVAGVATFDSVMIDLAATGYTLAASGAELSGATSDSLDISPGLATRYVIVDPPDTTVGTPILVRVEARDAFGNVVPGENRDVTLEVSGSATGGGRVDIVDGVGTRLISDLVAETVTLSLLDSQGTGLDVSSTQQVVFSPVGVARYVILDPVDGTVDAPISVTVEARDQFGNVVPSENRDVTLNVSGSAVGGGLVDIVDGVGTQLISDQLPETVTLTLTDSQGTGLDVSSAQVVVFAPGVATRYVIVDPVDGSVGTPVLVRVEARDQFDNVATGENRDVTLFTSGSATGGGRVSITDGVGTRLINDQVPETVTLSLVDTQVTGLDVSSTQDLVFAPVGATEYVILDPVDGSVDAPITVTIEARDQFGNLVVSENRDVTLVASGSATGDGLVDIVDGVGTQTLSDQVAETVLLSLLDSEGTGLTVSSTQNVQFASGIATRYVILDPTDGVVGTPIPVTVQARDQFGNVATGENRDVTLVTSGSATGGGQVSISNGVGTRLINDQAPETVMLSLLDSGGTGLDVSSTQDVVFAAVGATQFVILDPTDGTVDAPVTVTVQAQDQFGNVVASENRDVTLGVSGSAAGGGLVDIVNGVGTRTLTDQVAETVTLSLQDTQGTGLSVNSTQDVVFAPGAATRYVILDPTDGPVGTPIPVTVRALDQYGNVATDEDRDVTLNTSGSATGGGVVSISNGTGTRLINDQVPETVTLSLLDSRGTGLDVSSTQDVVFGPVGATQYVILDPTDGTVDAPITVTVQAQDAFGNVVAGENRDVTLNTSGSATGGGLVDIVNGVGTLPISDQVPETVTLTLTDSQGTGLTTTSTQQVAFAPGVATRYVILDPTDGPVGSSILVTVRALDQYGNVATSEGRDVALLTSGSATGGGLVSISGGVGTRTINDQVPETVTLSLLDSQGTGLDVSSTQAVVFTPVPATQFVILDPVDGTVDAPVTVTVQAQDQFGNVVASENRDVTLNASGSATGGGLVDIVSGVGTLPISDQVAQTVTLTLTDSQGTGLSTTSTQQLVFGPGVATQYMIVDPVNATVGTPILVTVRALDQYGNVATSEGRDVTLVTSGSATGGGLVNISSGIGTRTINDQVPETVILSLVDTQGTGLDVTSTQDVVFTPAGATRYVILNPVDGTVDAPITVTVQVQDQFGNIVASENRDVTLNASGSATGGGLVDIVNGVGTRPISDQVAETVALSLSDTEGTGLNTSSTQDVVFAPGSATRYVIVDPADGPVGTPIPVTVRALDQYGNLATGEDRNVTLNTSGSATGGGVVSISNGVGTRTINDQVPETVTLTLTDSQGTGLDVSSTQTVVFAPVGATQFVILDPVDGTVDAPISVTVQARDQFGNVVTSENRDVTLNASGSATGGGLVNVINGVGTRLISDQVPETVTLTLTDSEGTGLTVTSTQNAVFASGVATRYVIVDPADGPVGTPIPVTVRALDQYGNVATSEGRDVTLQTSGSATGGGVVSISGGTGTRLINDQVPETVTLSLLDSQGTGLDVSSTQQMVFTPAGATQYVILDPTDGTVDAPVTVTVEARDQFGNVVASENRDVTLNASASATGGGLVDIVSGVGTLPISDQVAETVTLTLTDSEGTGLTTTSTQNVVFSPGVATRYVILDPVDGPIGTPIPVTVRALDQYGNVATSEGRDVTLLTSGSATGGGVVNISSGTGTRTINDQVPETVTLSLLDSQGTGLDVSSTQTVVFGPVGATQFVILDPTDGSVDAPVTVTVQAQDQFGNVVASENRDVTLNASGSATGGGLVNIVNGTGTRPISDQVPETVTLSLLDTEGTGLNVSSTQNVVFAPGVATRYVIQDPVDGPVGSSILVTVRALDQYGNLATSEGRDVTLATSGSATGGGVVNISGGVGTRSITDQVPETVILSLLDTQGTGLDVTSTQDVVFTPAGATQYVILNPTDGTVDGPITVTVQAQDQFGNVVAGENRDVTLSASGSATGDGLVDIVNGVGTQTLSDQVAETVTLTLLDTQGTGLNVSSVQDVVFGPGAATRYVILDPLDAPVGTPILVTVQALDQFGNVATGEDRNVTLNTSGSATGGGEVGIQNGVGTRTINDQVPETVTLSLLDTQGTGLDVSSTQQVAFTPAAATQYVILDPTDGTVDAPVTVTVQAQDQFGNVVASENRDVTLNTSGAATGGGLVNIVNGVGTQLISDQVTETVTLTLTDSEGTGLNVSSAQNVVFAPGAATRYVILDPLDGPIGTPIPVTVRALDQYGNVATNENRDVTLLTSGSATGGGVVSISNGTGTRLINDQVPETVTLSLVDSQGTGLDVSSTQDVVFGPVGATQYVILDPTDGTVDAPITVTVQAQDAFGNVVAGENRDVTLNTSGSATGGGLVDIVNGVGTLPISDQVPETVTLTLTDSQGTGLNVNSTQNVVFASGLATRYVILDPVDGPIGTPILVTVRALDQFGNIATSEGRDVTLATTGSATGGGVVSISSGVGTRTINNQVPETVTLTLLDTQGTGLDVSSTQDVVFTPVGATQYVILNPTDGTVDGPVAVTVQAQDQFGNVVASENRDVTLNASGSATGDGLVDIVDGVGTQTLSDQVAETVTLTLTDSEGTGLTVTSTQDVVFGSGVATRYVILDPADGPVGTAITVTVQAQDQYGNVATGEDRNVTLNTSGSATGGGAVGISNGVGTRTINDQVPETVTLSLTDSQGTGLDVSSTQDVVFGPVAATQYVILDPTDGTVDAPIAVTVEARDQFGNVVTSENRDVTLNASSSATGGGLVDIVSGVGTLPISDQVAETVTLTLTDSEGTGLTVTSTQDAVFASGAATRYVILDPVDGPIGTPIPVTVRALDQYGNVATSEGRDVTLQTSGAATGGGVVSISNGTGTRLVNDQVPETVTLTLLDSQGTGLDVSSTQDVVFGPVGATQFVILDPVDGTVDVPVTVTVQARDQFGNVVASENRDVTLNASGSATGGGLVDIIDGVGTLPISDQVPETVTLTLTDSEGTGLMTTSTQNVVFAPGAATRYVILDPVDGTVGTPILVTVHAHDQFGNVATGEDRNVTLTTTGSATGGGEVGITDGVGTRTINDQVPETVVLALLDTQGTGLDVSSTQDVVFSEGAATQFVILDPTDGTVDAPITVTVQARDQFGNVVTGENRDVTLNTTGSATGGGVVDIVSGVGTLSISDQVPETVTLTLTDTEGTGLNVNSTQDVVFGVGATTRYVIVDPTDGTVDNPILVTVLALDQYDNVVSGEGRDVTLLTSGSATGGGVVNISNGTGTRFISDQVPETVTLSLADTEVTGLDVSSTQDVVFAAGTATQYVILDPTDGPVGTPIPVTVEAQDQFGNVVSSVSGSVTLVTDGSATGGGVVTISGGTGTVNINDQVPETVNLSLTGPTPALNVSSTQDVVFSVGAATQYVILDPTDGTAGTPIPVTVEAQDQFGNLVPSASGSVTLVTDGSATGGGVVTISGGTGTLNINDQVAETVNLSLTSPTPALNVSSTQDVVFSVGTATQYVILDPTDGTVGTPIPVTVEAQDQFGNFVSTVSGSVTLVTDGSATGGGVVTISGGTGSLSINDQVAETVNLSLTSPTPALNVNSTENVVFAAGAATQYVILDPTDGPVGTPIPVTVEAQDQFGNLVDSVNGSVTLVTDGSATGGGVVSISGGTGTVSINDQVPETVNLSLTSPTPALNVSSTEDVVFSVGAATQYLVTVSVGAPPAGSDVTVTAQLADQFDNPVGTPSPETVSWSSVGGGSFASPTSNTNVNGVATVVFTTNAALGTNHTVTANDGSVSGTSAVFRTGANRYVIVDPTDGPAGTPIPVTVRAEDGFGTVDAQEQRNVRLVATGNASAGVVDIVNGVGVRNVTNDIAETVTLSLRDDVEVPPTGLDVSSTQDVVFQPAAADKYVILDPVDGTVNSPVTVTVQAWDVNGNLVPDVNGSVTLRTSGSATPVTSVVTITDGEGTTVLNDAVNEAVTLTLETPTPPLDVSSTQSLVFFPEGDWTMVALGNEHACGVTSLGTLYCWGNNASGQLGDGGASGAFSNTPALVAGGLTFASVDAGEAHTCALAPDGTAYCWGDNSLGQLGDAGASGTGSNVPVAVSGGLTFASVSVANHGFHTCGVTSTGQAYCWGSDSDGQLGNGTTGDGSFSNVPVSVAGGLTFQSVSTGLGHSCGIVSDNTAYCWGANSWRQLGTGNSVPSSSPIAVAPPLGQPGALSFTSLHAGRYHTCGLAIGGDGYCWGQNTFGQIGDGTNELRREPTAVSGGLTFSSMTSGANQACGIVGGEGYCWGSGGEGRLGNGSQFDVNVPTAVYGQVPLSLMSSGQRFTCAINSAGTGAYCFGHNSVGQLGTGSADPRSLTPVRVSDP